MFHLKCAWISHPGPRSDYSSDVIEPILSRTIFLIVDVPDSFEIEHRHAQDPKN